MQVLQLGSHCLQLYARSSPYWSDVQTEHALVPVVLKERALLHVTQPTTAALWQTTQRVAQAAQAYATLSPNSPTLHLMH